MTSSNSIKTYVELLEKYTTGTTFGSIQEPATKNRASSTDSLLHLFSLARSEKSGKTNPACTQKSLSQWGEIYGPLKSLSNHYTLLTKQTAEHFVFFDYASFRAVKVLHPNEFGMKVTVTSSDAQIAPACLYDYLIRIALFNAVFDGDITIEGVEFVEDTFDHTRIPCLVTSQRWEEAENILDPCPDSRQIREYMRSLGFLPGHRTHQWYRQADQVYIADAREDNFILTKDGVRAIDLIITLGKE